MGGPPPAEGARGAARGEGQVHPDVGEVVYAPEAIAARVAELGRELGPRLAGARPLVLVTLKGAFVFAADLVRALEPAPAGLELAFVKASSYGAGTTSSGAVALGGGGVPDVAGRNVLVVEDIVDTGRTMEALFAAVEGAGAASVLCATLLNKQARRTIDLAGREIHVGFECPDEFVIGYGLDFDEQYRALPYVGTLREDLIPDH